MNKLYKKFAFVKYYISLFALLAFFAFSIFVFFLSPTIEYYLYLSRLSAKEDF